MLTPIQRSVLSVLCSISWTSICSDAERLFHQRDHSDLQSGNGEQAEPVTDPHTAEMFLSRYGFLKPVDWDETFLDVHEETDFLDLGGLDMEEGALTPPSRDVEPVPPDPHFVSALRDFQKLSGLQATGVLDEATREAMNKPRCGVPDVEVDFSDEGSDDELKEFENVDDPDSVQKSKMEDVEALDGLLRDADGNNGTNDNFKSFSSESNDVRITTSQSDRREMSDIEETPNNSSDLLSLTGTNPDSKRSSKIEPKFAESLNRTTNTTFVFNANNITKETKPGTHERSDLTRSGEDLENGFDKDLSEETVRSSFSDVSDPDSDQIFKDFDRDNTLESGSSDGPFDLTKNVQNTSGFSRSEASLQRFYKTEHDLPNNSTIKLKIQNQTEKRTPEDGMTDDGSDGGANVSETFASDFLDFLNESDPIVDHSLGEDKSDTSLIDADGYLETAEAFLVSGDEAGSKNVPFVNFNKTNSHFFTFNRPTDNDTRGNMHQKSGFDDFAAGEIRNRSTIFDPVDTDTNEDENLKENSMLVNVSVVSFSDETALNLSTISDQIDNDGILQQNPFETIFQQTEGNTYDKTVFDSIDDGILMETTSLKPFEAEGSSSNETQMNSSFDSRENETRRQSSAKRPKDFTKDDLNSISNNRTVESLHKDLNETETKGSLDKHSLQTVLKFSTLFDLFYTEAPPGPVEPLETKTESNSGDETNVNSSTLSTGPSAGNDHRLHKTTTKDERVRVVNISAETNFSSSTVFDPMDNDTVLENHVQKVLKETKGSRSGSRVKVKDSVNETNFDPSTLFDPNDINTTEETNLDSKTTFEQIPETKESLNIVNSTNLTDLNNSTVFYTNGNETRRQTTTQTPPGAAGGARGGTAVRRRRHLASLVGGGRSRREAGHVAFSKSVLRWRLIGEGYSSQLSVEEQRYVFRLAFRMWSEVCPLDFIEDNAAPLEEVDVRLGFGTGRHLGCRQRFDGSGREFAHAWFLGDIHFDDDEHFTGPSAGRGISLLKVAVHEIGHVLGLPHIYRPGSIMQPSYRPQEARFEVDWMDRKAIQNLYGGCRGRFDTVFDLVRRERTARGELRIRFNTYFMRRGWYWLYENRNNRTRFGDPLPLQSGWRGLPLDGVDAYVHVWSRRRDHAYFFKGAWFWRYDSERDQVFRRDPEGHSYPRPISEGFPGVPVPIDTAVYDRRDGNIYFFKNKLVYAFSVDSRSVARGYPRPLRSVFPPLDPQDHPESGLDAAYFSYSHNALFLFKDTLFWRVTGARERRTRSLRRNTLLPHREVHQSWYDICNVHPSALRVTP